MQNNIITDWEWRDNTLNTPCNWWTNQWNKCTRLLIYRFPQCHSSVLTSTQCQVRVFHREISPRELSTSWRFQFIMFTEGANSCQLLKRKSSKELRSRVIKAIEVTKTASSLSSWNFHHKVRYNEPLVIALFFLLPILTHDISKLCSPCIAFSPSVAFLISIPSVSSWTSFFHKP